MEESCRRKQRRWVGFCCRCSCHKEQHQIKKKLISLLVKIWNIKFDYCEKEIYFCTEDLCITQSTKIKSPEDRRIKRNIYLNSFVRLQHEYVNCDPTKNKPVFFKYDVSFKKCVNRIMVPTSIAIYYHWSNWKPHR